MKVRETKLEGVVLIEPAKYEDKRGFFMEVWHRHRYAEVGLPGAFVQDNISFSRQGVLRGLHFQNPSPQGKLVSVLDGEVFDVAVDVRRGAPTFSQWVGAVLSSRNGRQIYIPEGYAHGFVVTSETALILYKCTDYYAPDCEYGILWNDPEVVITWPVEEPIVSAKDAAVPRLRDLPEEVLPEPVTRGA